MFVQHAGQACSLRAKTPLIARPLSLRCCLGQTNHIFSVYNLIHLEGFNQTQRFHAVSLHPYPQCLLKGQNDPWQQTCNMKDYPAFQDTLVSPSLFNYEKD